MIGLNAFKKPALSLAVGQYLQGRSLLYNFERLPLPLINHLFGEGVPNKPTKEQFKEFVKAARQLIKDDAKDFADGIYPAAAYKPDKLLTHWITYNTILLDALFGVRRKKKRVTDYFTFMADNPDSFPDYYKRNFHHQTDGYLSEYSAFLYEHQVELLFSGLAAPMRRRILRPMKNHFGTRPPQRILEVACGTGTFTKQLAETFPETKIIATDLSPAYIRYAKRRFKSYNNIDFRVANAEELPFESESFDACVSIYMHHELPETARRNALTDTLRVTKKEGFWGLVDSIQKGDIPISDDALDYFPQDFHEPFYKNYINKSLKGLMSQISPQSQFTESYHTASKVFYRLQD